MMLFRHILTLIAVIAALGLPMIGGFAGEAALPPELAEWRKIDFSRYPDANTVLLDDCEKIEYSADGNYTLSDDYFVYLKTEKGRDENRIFTLSFNEFYQYEPEVTISVIRPDGSLVQPELQRKVTTEAGQMQSTIFDPANKVLSIGVPDLAVGDIVHINYQMASKHPRMKGIWCDIGVLQSIDPILRYEYTISAPEKTPLASISVKDEVKDTLTFRQEKKDGRIHYTWIARNVPQIIPEPGMPPYYLCAMRVLASTAPDWKTISRWYWELCRPHLEAVSPELSAKSKALAKGKKPREAIRAIFDFVSKEVRYTGITDEKTAPGYEPHDVKQTFAQLHGVCRDKAALLAAMLREAGLEAYPVLFMVGTPKDAETPNNFFNHAITGVRLADGELILMDATNENSAELLPAYEMNMSYLVASPEGENLRRTPEIPAEKNLARITSAGTLDRNFTLQMHSKVEFSGINDAMYRGAFARWSRDYAKRFFAASVKQSLPGAELVSFRILPEDVRDLSRPLVVELDYTLANAVEIGWGEGMIAIPYLRLDALMHLLQETELAQRKYPLEFDSTAALMETVTVKLPDNLTAAGVPEKIVSEKGTFSAKIAVTAPDKHTLQASLELALHATAVSPEEYLKLKNTLKSLEIAARSRVVVRRDFAAGEIAKLFPDAHIAVDKREETLNVLAADRAEFQVRETKRVLTYGGVKGASQWQCTFYPDWEKISDFSGTVTAPSGTKQKIPKSAIEIMDAPGNAAAPRYPHAKVMVAALPGVAPGSVIELDYTISQFGNDEIVRLFVLDAPATVVREKRISVNCPEALAKSFAVRLPESGFPLSKTVSDGKVCWTVSARNLPPRAQEPNPPPAWSFAPHAGWSTAAPEQLAECYRTAFQKAASKSPEAQKKALELTKNVATQRGKVLAIRNFVAEHIRAAGPDLSEVGAKAFTDADTTLRDGYGSSADRAALLAAMLQAAGVENIAPVAVSGLPALREITGALETLPLPVFDDVLLRVTIAGEDGETEEEFYLGDTDQYARLGATAHDNMLALDLASGELITVVSAPNCADAVETVCTITCEPGGTAKVVLEQHFFGGDYGAYKRLLARQTPEEKRRYIEGMTQNISELAQMLNFTADFDGYPGVIAGEWTIPNFWDRSGDYVYLTLPQDASGDAIRTSGARTLPYLRSEAAEINTRYTVELPESVQCLELSGRDFEWRAPGGCGSAVQHAALDGKTVSVTRSVHLEPMVVNPAEYPVLAEGERLLNGAASRAILVKVSGR